ncbi:MAG: hypothetical protein QXJ06_00535 [Candidatus Aenigmatarchaeota archaeon]
MEKGAALRHFETVFSQKAVVHSINIPHHFQQNFYHLQSYFTKTEKRQLLDEFDRVFSSTLNLKKFLKTHQKFIYSVNVYSPKTVLALEVVTVQLQVPQRTVEVLSYYPNFAVEIVTKSRFRFFITKLQHNNNFFGTDISSIIRKVEDMRKVLKSIKTIY